MKKSRGRPLGFKLSEESKRAISEAKRGQRHTEETKDKISRTLMLYFRNMYPLSKEFTDDYKDILEDDLAVQLWYESIKSNLDNSSDIFTEKSLNSKRLREVSIEYNIDMTNSFNNTVNSFTSDPEKMCELKMLCEQKGLDLETMVEMLDSFEDTRKESIDE